MKIVAIDVVRATAADTIVSSIRLSAIAGALAVSAIAAPGAQAATVTLDASYALAPELGRASSNFHPQGMGYDASTDELLFAQQATSTIYRTDLTGSLLGSATISGLTVNRSGSYVASSSHHTVSVAADDQYYYFSDYTSNTSGLDLHRVAKTGGVSTPISDEIAAFGGYPIDVAGGLLYRTEPTTDYSFANLGQIRVSSLASPDTVTQTLTLAGANGIADFAIDQSSASIFTLDYSANASVRRFDLATGALLDSFDLGVDGLTAGLAYGKGKLYVYDWALGDSTLGVYSVGGLGGAVPEPATWALLILGFGVVGSALRRSKAAVTVRYA